VDGVAVLERHLHAAHFVDAATCAVDVVKAHDDASDPVAEPPGRNFQTALDQAIEVGIAAKATATHGDRNTPNTAQTLALFHFSPFLTGYDEQTRARPACPTGGCQGGPKSRLP
jgi:hypothetical protein